MTLELPLADGHGKKLDDLLRDVETAVDDAFLAEVDAAFDRIRVREPEPAPRRRKARRRPAA